MLFCSGYPNQDILDLVITGFRQLIDSAYRDNWLIINDYSNQLSSVQSFIPLSPSIFFITIVNHP